MSLESILAMKGEEIKHVPPLPVGTYTLQLFGKPNFVDQSRRGGTDYVDFQAKVVAIGDTVSQEQLDQFPGGRNAVVGMELRGRGGTRFYLSDAALPMLKEWMVDILDIDPTLSLKEMCFQVPGKMCLAEMQQEPTQDGKRMVSNIRSYAKIG
jgi:hypothetical protein